MVWACDAKGRDSHYKKYTKYEYPEMATDRARWSVMVKNVDTTQMVEDGKGLVTVSKTVIRAYVCVILKHVLQQYIIDLIAITDHLGFAT